MRIIESDYGRDFGWFVIRDGERIASLSDCQHEEMFWDSYIVEPMTDDPDLNRRLQSAFWQGDEWSGCEFVSREFPDVVVRHALPAASPILESGRLLLRGLYCSEVTSRPWDWLFMWWRKKAAIPARTRGAANNMASFSYQRQLQFCVSYCEDGGRMVGG